MAARRYWMLIAVVALLCAATLVYSQHSDEAVIETDTEPAAASTMDQYKVLAQEYIHKATEVGKVYAAQAQELATKYVAQAQHLLQDTLDKLGAKKQPENTEL